MKTLRIEFHCHSIYSKDSLARPEDLIKTARKRGIDKLIITDHNNITGALAAKKMDPDLIIVGEEIMTTRGELLASFVTEEVPPWLEPAEAIRRLRAQGAFISVSHPFDTFRSGHWQEADLDQIIPHVDAIEGFNSRCMTMQPNIQAGQYAMRHNLAQTVGSDAHTAWEVGRATLILPAFSNAQGLRDVIRSAQKSTQLSSPAIHLSSRFATTVKKMGFYRKQVSSHQPHTTQK